MEQRMKVYNTGIRHQSIELDMNDLVKFKEVFGNDKVTWAGMVTTFTGTKHFIMSCVMMGINVTLDELPENGTKDRYVELCNQIKYMSIPDIIIPPIIKIDDNEVKAEQAEMEEIKKVETYKEDIKQFVAATKEKEDVIVINESTIKTIKEEDGINMSKTVEVKATATAEANKGKVEAGAKWLINNVKGVRDFVVNNVRELENMTQAEIEDWLETNAADFYNTVIVEASTYASELKEELELFPELGESSRKVDGIIATLADIVDDKNKNGWGKFKSIVLALVKWIVSIFIKVGAIILKIGITIIVGAVKIAAVAIGTGIRTGIVVNNEVIKPVINNTSVAVDKFKQHKADKKFADSIMDEVEDEAYEA